MTDLQPRLAAARAGQYAAERDVGGTLDPWIVDGATGGDTVFFRRSMPVGRLAVADLTKLLGGTQ